ncbi:MAG: nitrite/sulfite reductase [Rhodospirillales bacterium]|nr:nitrite/sulfite reductase [Rhodospirillales bacterium]
MYRYDEFDRSFVNERVAEFRGQVARRMSGEMSEEEFRPLRLMNGLYLQLHAYMLRVAIPYGTFSSVQMRKLAHIARTYDRGYGHFTTRQNIQFNWPKLEQVPVLLAELADVEMHAIQTSGNCIRNVTADPYAGAVADEVDDSRIWAEIVRQWSTLHPEFTYLGRKFKIAVSASDFDRAVIRFHDIGLIIKRNEAGEIGFQVWVGGGLGRTPMIAKVFNEFVPQEDLLSYLEAVLRVYNMYGRRDNKYKARIKILVHETGLEELRAQVDAEWQEIRNSSLKVPDYEIERIRSYFAPPPFEKLDAVDRGFEIKKFENPEFARWVNGNVVAHRQPGYKIVNISLKPEGLPPGDVTADQMEELADLAETYSFDEIRATHEQNLVFAHVKQSELFELWQELGEIGLAMPNIGKVTDMIACPGLDYCALANARAIPLAQRISRRYADLDKQFDLGELKLKISGCINACGHHHVGHIGLLGVDRRGEEYYQITLGGSGAEDAAIGSIIGPAFSSADVVDAIESVISLYVELRDDNERFLDTYRRVGTAPFKSRLYPEKLDAAA